MTWPGTSRARVSSSRVCARLRDRAHAQFRSRRHGATRVDAAWLVPPNLGAVAMSKRRQYKPYKRRVTEGPYTVRGFDDNGKCLFVLDLDQAASVRDAR